MEKGKERKRYGVKNLTQLLKFISIKPTEKQKNILEIVMDNFRQGVEFRDDVTIIGIKL